VIHIPRKQAPRHAHHAPLPVLSVVFPKRVEIKMDREIQSLVINLNLLKKAPRHAQIAPTQALNGKVFIHVERYLLF
jgi:hypothetical protein